MESPRELFDIGNYRYFSDVYIETGAGAGASIERAKKAGFKQIHSIEANEKLYTYVRKRYPSANLYLGLSKDKLPGILGNCSDRVCILLDAHPAGPDTYGHKECLAGDSSVFQHTILLQELAIILAHRNDHLIIIDDQTPESIVPYVDILSTANPQYEFKLLDEQLGENEIYFRDKILVAIPPKLA